MDKTDEIPKPPVSGVIYGELAFWFALAGLVVAVIGVAWYLSDGPAVIKSDILLDRLLKGDSPEKIWEAAGSEVSRGHWYLKKLSFSDALAMLGISICCVGGVVGMWGALAGLIISKKEKQKGMYPLYLTLVIIMAILLTLSAIGVISLH